MLSKIKNLFIFIIVIFFSIIVFQNKEYFFEKNTLMMDLFFKKITVASIYNIYLYIGFFLIGSFSFIIAYFISIYKENQFCQTYCHYGIYY